MRVVDHRWPWMALALTLFVAGMAGIHYLQRGINEDFGFGFSLGLVIGAVLVLTAVGWRRGEMRREGQ